VVGAVGEIFSSLQGEGLYVGRKQIFVRFYGCPLRCVYCDTKDFWTPKPSCRVEVSPGSGKFRELGSLDAAGVVREVLRLRTADTHSVSLTGGEPLASPQFLLELLRGLRGKNLKTYLETAGTDAGLVREISGFLDFACVDLKLPDHRAVPAPRWRDLVESELECIGVLKRKGVGVFGKIVLLETSSPKIFSWVCRRISELGAPLVLQPVTPLGGARPPSKDRLLRMSSLASSCGVEEVAVIPQVHKLMGLP
jgi:organic radical activating enzyme